VTRRGWNAARQIISCFGNGVFLSGGCASEAGRPERWQHKRSWGRPREPWREISFLVDRRQPRNRIGRRSGSCAWKSTTPLWVSSALARIHENPAERWYLFRQVPLFPPSWLRSGRFAVWAKRAVIPDVTLNAGPTQAPTTSSRSLPNPLGSCSPRVPTVGGRVSPE
jgi:hypothetical protein